MEVKRIAKFLEDEEKWEEKYISFFFTLQPLVSFLRIRTVEFAMLDLSFAIHLLLNECHYTTYDCNGFNYFKHSIYWFNEFRFSIG